MTSVRKKFCKWIGFVGPITMQNQSWNFRVYLHEQFEWIRSRIRVSPWEVQRERKTMTAVDILSLVTESSSHISFLQSIIETSHTFVLTKVLDPTTSVCTTLEVQGRDDHQGAGLSSVHCPRTETGAVSKHQIGGWIRAAQWRQEMKTYPSCSNRLRSAVARQKRGRLQRKKCSTKKVVHARVEHIKKSKETTRIGMMIRRGSNRMESDIQRLHTVGLHERLFFYDPDEFENL